MVRNIMPKEEWAEVAPAFIRRKKQYYYLRVNPQENDGMITSIEELVDHEPTEEDKTTLYVKWLAMEKKVKLHEIEQYDTSDNVNIFEIGGVSAWLDKATRVGLKNSLAVEAEAGHETTTLYLNGNAITLQVTKAVEMLDELELYAIECYRQTEVHKAAVNALSVIEDVEGYDYTTGYPQHPVFE